MSLIRWDPFQDSGDLMQRFNQLLNRSPMSSGELAKVDWRPAADIIENDKEYLIKAELPEVKKDDIHIEMHDGVLTLRGERKLDKEHKDDKVHRVESFYGSFSRSFRLPDDVDVEAISAESRDGVLKVRLPKTKAAKPRSVEITVK
ncbi:MAG: Hsp20/alpha crystallin family protein [Gammaproteobacteria bacterium]|nr:Hsp20/alpha crystallin family protein [Gammaproteobacteria bacterium]